MSRVVLVTGCSAGGIGFAVAQEFAKEGCTVYATARNPDKIGESSLPSLLKLKLDVTSDEDVQRVVDHIIQEEGKIDVIVNNAGVISPGPLIDQTMEDVKLIFDTNTFAVLRLARAVIPLMAKQQSGVIVNIGSVVEFTPTPWNGLYCATKAAVQSISDVLTMECKPFNIDIVHVAPAAVVSNISNNGAAHYTLPSGSLYSRFLPNIMQRIYASQGPHSMPTENFARGVVSKVLKKSPPRYLLIGGNSLLFMMFQWLPKSVLLWIMWRIYSKKLS